MPDSDKMRLTGMSLSDSDESQSLVGHQTPESMQSVDILAHNDARPGSGISSLPPEIIAEIFTHFLLIDGPAYPPISGIFSPQLLCEVCSLWRQIALSTPWLWEVIQLEIRPDESPTSAKKKLGALNLWLSRSGTRPLTIWLHYIHPHGQLEPRLFKVLSDFLRAIVHHCHRWEYMEIILPFQILYDIQGDMPLLKRLVFGPSELPDQDEIEEMPSQAELFSAAPQLTHVVLSESFVPSMIRLPWSQLTTLEGLCLYDHECAEILRHTCNLVHFTAALVCDFDPHLTEEITLIHLVDLILSVKSSWEGNDIAHLLHSLRVPALRILDLPEPFVSGGDPRGTIEELISRSGCDLWEIRIREASMAETVYRHTFPSIATLTIETRHIPL
ncbi:F-box domain-containing protein [Favolaschia claudopus]|uniref:F-box domain-containing protein n=1 Tax=Favolaschia claudopus TaxID=2862362 RepID=A0AAW0AYU4_9AGAR